jgi:protein TonB
MHYIVTFFLCFAFLTAFPQKKVKKEVYYAYDGNWNPCELETAKYIAYVQKLSDTIWQWNFYHILGSLMHVETFYDEDATIPSGYFSYFNKKGMIDSCGNVTKGLRNGRWLFFEDSLRPQLTKEYSMGQLVGEKRTSGQNNNIELKPGEIEADFPGGTKAWIRYLEKNVKFPERAQNNNIQGTVYIYFFVDVNGKVSSPFISRSVELSIDIEAMRLINNSPLWNPAIQDGKKVKAYRIQPISFYLSN